MAQEKLKQEELKKVENINDALKDLREKQGDEKNYSPEFYAYLKKTNPAVFKLVMDMDLSNPEAPDAALKLAVAQSLLSVWLDTKAPVEKAYEVKERKEKTFTIGDEYPIKVEQLSNGKWEMNGDINLIYGSKEDAERDGAMIQKALESIKSKKIEPEHYDDPFYAGLIDRRAMFIHEVGVDEAEGMTPMFTATRDARTLAKSALGLAPSMEQLANLANTLLKNSGETGKETSERLKTKTEIEEVKLGSAPALNVTLVDKLVNELVMSGAPKFDYEIVSDNEVEIRSHGAENITILKDGENWIVEGSDNKLKYSSINSAVKDAVLMQEMESIAMKENVVVPDGEKGPYYVNFVTASGISVHTDGLTDPDVSRSWANLARTDVKTEDLVNFMNEQYAEKASIVQEREAKLADDGEILDRKQLVKTFKGLKSTYPELGDPEKIVVDKDYVEITSTFSSEPIGLEKKDGEWSIHNTELKYDSLVDAVTDALLTQKIEYDAEKLKDKITKGKESGPFVDSVGGYVGLDTEGLDTRWPRSMISNGVNGDDFVAYLNDRWADNLANRVEVANDGMKIITEEERYRGDGYSGVGRFIGEDYVIAGTFQDGGLLEGTYKSFDGGDMETGIFDPETGFLVKGTLISGDGKTHEIGTFTNGNDNTLIDGTRVADGKITYYRGGKEVEAPEGKAVETIDDKFSVEKGKNGRMKIINSMEATWEFDNQKLKDLNGGVMPKRIGAMTYGEAPTPDAANHNNEIVYYYDEEKHDFYDGMGKEKLVINQDRPEFLFLDKLDTSKDEYKIILDDPKVEATEGGELLMKKLGISIKTDPGVTDYKSYQVDFGFTKYTLDAGNVSFKVKADGEKLIITQYDTTDYIYADDVEEPNVYVGYSGKEILNQIMSVELQHDFHLREKIKGDVKRVENGDDYTMKFNYRGQDVVVTTEHWDVVNIGGVDCNTTDEFTIDFFIDEMEKETGGASGSTSTDVPTTTNTSPEEDAEVAPAPTVDAAHGDGEPVETETKVIEKQGAGTFTVDLGDEEMTKKIQDVVKDAEKTPVATSDRAGYEGKTFYYDKEKGSYYTADGERLKIYNGDKVTLSEDKRSEAEKEVAKDTAAAKAKATEATKVENKPEVAQVVDRITSKENADLLVRLNDYKTKGYKEPAMKISRDDVMSQIDKALIGHELSNADTAKLLAFKGEISGSDKVEDSKRAEKMSLAWTKSYAEALQYAKASGLKVDLNVVSKGMHENNKVLKVTVGEGAKAKSGEIKVVIPILGKVEAYDKANHVRITYKGKENDDVLAAVKVAIADLSKS